MNRFVWLSVTFVVMFVSESNGQEDFANQLDNSAKEFLSKGMLDSAASRLDQRALYFKEKNRLADYISAYVEIADLYVQADDYLKSQYYLNRIDPGTINAVESEVTTSLIEWYLYQGYVSEKMGDYLSAKEYYETVNLRLVTTEHEKQLELGRYLYQPLGNIYTRLGEYEKAVVLLEKFRELSLTSENQDAKAEAYNDLSIVYQSTGQSGQAILLYKEALKIPGLSGMSKGILLSNLSASLLTAGNTDEALTTSTEALSYFSKATDAEQSLQNNYEAWTYGVMAQIYFNRTNYVKALTSINNAIKYSRAAFGPSVSREIAKLYTLKGSILLETDDINGALLNFQLALTSLFQSFKETNPDRNPDVLMLFPENAILEALQGKSEAYYKQYLKEKDMSSLVKALNIYELIFEVEDKIAREFDFQPSKLILLTERNERSHQAMDICYLLYQHTRDNAYIDIGFDIMERNKARVLLESQSEISVNKALEVSQDLLLQRQQHRKTISYLQNILRSGEGGVGNDSIVTENLFQAQKNLDIVNQQLSGEYPDYFRLVDQKMKRTSIKDLQENFLPDSQRLIEFFFSDHFLYIMDVGKRHVSWKQIDVPVDFFPMIESYLKRLRKPSHVANEVRLMYETSFEVYQHLLRPIFNGEFPEQCILIPDGILTYLPFETLITQDPSDTGKRLAFLLNETSISYAFSATILQQDTQRETVNSSLENFIGFAPGFVGSKLFQPLMYSQDEVKKISFLLRGAALEDAQASKSAFLNNARKYKIVHLSTHAAVGKDSPVLSWIAFSDTFRHEEDSFKLFLSEIYDLQLRSELVVLSACETGTGFFAKGEGVMSLARGFAFAGCASTVMTLWQVNDHATSIINQSFYQYLVKGWSKDRALRQAKLDYINGGDIDPAGQHPYFWSSLVLMGDSRSMELSKPDYRYAIATAVVVCVSIAFFVVKKRRRWNSAS